MSGRATRRVPPAAREAILDWFEGAGRALPFRATSDPYAILVSEAMAQQTQAARAGASWTSFMAVFPTVRALAEAQLADVLRAWQGLGYNRRAVHLWRAAQVIVARHEGAIPSDVPALEALPGVGPYTARAVAAIAFGRSVGAVDTNVRRVLSRMLWGGTVPSAGDVQRAADGAVPADRPGAWTHALMDVGARFCRPGRPDCAGCPARAWCRFAAEPDRRPGERARPRREAQSFATTTRWLRGRIVDRLRAVRDGGWTTFDGPIGAHDLAAVAAALVTLGREGLIDLRPADAASGAWLARLPIA